MTRDWWYSDSGGTRRPPGLGPQPRRGDCVQRSQRLLWTVAIRGGVLVEGALGRAWKDQQDRGRGKREDLPKEGSDMGKGLEREQRGDYPGEGEGARRLKPAGLARVKLVPGGWACWAGEF